MSTSAEAGPPTVDGCCAGGQDDDGAPDGEPIAIACTLSPESVAGRLDDIERLRAGLTDVERTGRGLLLRFPPRFGPEVRRFTVDEQACCAFWEFEIEEDPAAVTLRWGAPPAAGGIVDQLHEFFRGDRPLSSVSGLL